MRRNKAIKHISVKQALAFSSGGLNKDIVDPCHFAEPTVDDCVRFIGWHSAGEYISPREFRERPGLCRLVEGHNSMGMLLGLEDDQWSWAYGFKYGWLFLSDFDGDELSYAIDDERFVHDGNSFTWETTYDDAGEYVFTATVSDGVDITSQEFTVSIENINRAPIILDIVQR